MDITDVKISTPYFILYENKLIENISAFQSALFKIWPNSQLSYSVKTNSLPWLLKYLHKSNIFAEVVSDEEFDLVKLCDYKNNQIIFNGPIKSKEKLIYAINNNSIVNLDSKKDIDVLCSLNLENINNIGIRINVNPNVFLKEDIGYVEDGFRFGFSEESGELNLVINKIKSKFKKSNFGLHLHCNSITRSIEVYKSISKYAVNIIKKYNLEPSFIDVGGGFFGGVENKPTAYQYIETIKKEFIQSVDINKTKLFIEPGSAIIGSAMDLVTSVIDVKDTLYSRIVTTDGSRIHIDPLWKKNKYLYDIKSNSIEKINKQIVCGYTCMDHDRIMILQNEKELKIGDKIIYKRNGAYSVTFGGMFIRYLPDVYVKKLDDSLERIRKRIDVNDYFNINYIN